MNRKGPLLVLDTATGRNGAMVHDGAPLAVRLSLGDRPRSNEIFALARLALADAGVAPADLAAVAVTIGPGSFTGLRVGYGLAAGFADALGLPLLGVPTLTAMAVGSGVTAATFAGTLVPLLTARKGELYAALFTVAPYAGSEGRPPLASLPSSSPTPRRPLETAHCHRLTPDFAPTPDELAARLVGPVLFVGDGFDPAGPLAAKGKPLEGFGATGERSALMGVALLAADALADGREGEYPPDLVYVRRSQAQINWDRLHPQPSQAGGIA
ncbi:MAG: tRNA (adenosine(37)-N6)-threonylcarbamoyltransferase complex dimerization subunit type 1 TsaB [Nitrospinae bacterium]|nr:tRNA (adenosine(37)-N6)-threonylcarbamoyltransferase complex dimerization subunit type 1 TsaB [Nitrospinota bacterium]